jgi:hypothetical protein
MKMELPELLLARTETLTMIASPGVSPESSLVPGNRGGGNLTGDRSGIRHPIRHPMRHPTSHLFLAKYAKIMTDVASGPRKAKNFRPLGDPREYSVVTDRARGTYRALLL